MNFGLKEEMGFDAVQIKSLLQVKPKLWLMSKRLLHSLLDTLLFLIILQLYLKIFHYTYRQIHTSQPVRLCS
jgi:hypothetical protein